MDFNNHSEINSKSETKDYKNIKPEHNTNTNESKSFLDTFYQLKDMLSPLSEADKRKLKEETGWSDEIIDSIQTKKEAEVLKNADVHEEEINGKKCLIRNDIDMNQVDESTGMTNKERMEDGKAPLDKDGNKIELHHIGQRKDSPLVELKPKEHDEIPNPKQDSEVHNDTNEKNWKQERENHWETRAGGI